MRAYATRSDERSALAPRTSGRPLDTTTRRWMESRFQHDFSQVRVHAGDAAADRLGARAFTVNRDIAFAEREYAPHSAAGLHLLAHELAHVAGADERHADLAANDVMAGRTPVFERTAAPNAIHMKPKSLQETADAIAKELEALIQVATWPEIRKTAYPRESAPGIKRAAERRAKTRPDLTGLGKIATLDHFASIVRMIQKSWGTLTPDERKDELANAAGAELIGVGVPAFMDKRKAKMNAKASFSSWDWGFSINEDLVNAATLPEAQGAEVTTVALHEARHAEQHFLAARYSAKLGKDAAEIVTLHSIPDAIAKDAVAKKFDDKSDKADVSFGKTMRKAHVTDVDKKAETNEAFDAATVELDTRRATAEAALNDLKASATKDTVFKATQARKKLKKQIAILEWRYSNYRKLPSEIDAHEVGDAAGEAFKLSTP